MFDLDAALQESKKRNKLQIAADLNQEMMLVHLWIIARGKTAYRTIDIVTKKIGRNSLRSS